ncbi:cadherin domain-containing protein [Marinicaulis aureus]|uniref:Cadherin domain-containing protein n=1 Tax=Hyphococcus aureus TaxID=2666033 RepID=A0ABW1L1V6_9PROT
MAKDQPATEVADENKLQSEDRHRIEDAAFENDRDALKKARDEEKPAIEGGDNSGDYANLHFGEQNLYEPEAVDEGRTNESQIGPIASPSLASDGATQDEVGIDPDGLQGHAPNHALYPAELPDTLPLPDETTDGEAFQDSRVPEILDATVASGLTEAPQLAGDGVEERSFNKTPQAARLTADRTNTDTTTDNGAEEGNQGAGGAIPEDTLAGDGGDEGEINEPTANLSPTDIILDGGSASENLAGALVAHLSADDPDRGDTSAFTLIRDDSGLFELVGDTLQLKDDAAFDYEVQSSYDVTLGVTDSAGNTFEKTVSIHVENVNEAPTDIGLSSFTIAENVDGGVVGDLSVLDPDAGEGFSFTVSDDRFEVVGNQLKLKDGVALDAETTAPFNVNIMATDSGGLTINGDFTVSVLDQNEAPVIEVIHEAGLRASYYNIGHSLSDLDEVDFDAEPDARGVVDSLNYMTGQESFWDGAPGDYFAAKYEGNLVVNEGGSYTFNMASDDGSMLFIDGVAVLDNDGLHGTRTRTVTVDLDSGSHDIEIRYFENGGSQTLQLSWSGPDTGGVTEVIGGDSFEYGASIDNLTLDDDSAGAVVARLSVSDPDIGDTHTYSVNDDRFEVVDEGGGTYLKLKDGVAVDYEVESALNVEVTVTDAGGASNTLNFPITVIDTNHAPSIELMGGEGLRASYYNIGHSLSDLDQVDFNAAPDAEGIVDSLNYMAGQESFWDGAPGDYFAAKYEGQILVEEGGVYTFNMASDDGSMLFIDGVAVLDNDGLHSTRTRTVSVDLDSGSHDIEVRYFENGGSQTLQLSWSGPDTNGITEVIGSETYRLPGFEDTDRLGLTENAEGDIAAHLTISDIENDSVSITVDDERFEVVNDSDGYVLKLKDGVHVNYEAESEISVTVTATDAHGESSTQSFSIPVLNVDETPVNFTLSADDSVGSLSLNQDGGTDDAVIASDLAGFPTNALTVEVRFSSEQTDVGNGTPLFSYAASDGSDNEALIWLEGSSGNMHIFLAGQKINTGVPNASLLDGEEHQVSFTWDQVSNELHVYVDGESAFDATINIRDLKAGGTLVLGQEQDSEGGGFVTGQVFEGEIAEVRIFDYARSESEIADNTGVSIADPETEPGLTNNWVMNEASGGVIEDLVGTDDFQLVNGAHVEGGAIFDTPTVLENNPGAIAGTLSATDPDTGAPIDAFAIVNDPSGAFEIVGNEVKLKDGISLDYESQSSYELTIEAKGPDGETAQQTFTVAVANQDEAPVDFNLDPAAAVKVLSLNQDGGVDDAAISSELAGFPTDALTVEVRFSSDQTDVGGGAPLLSYAANDGSNNEALLFLEGASGTLQVYIAGQKINTGVTNQSLLDGQEHQVSFTWDQDSNELHVYVDGEAAFDTTVNIRDLKAGGTVSFGQEQDAEAGGFDSNQVFEGEIAEVRIFDYARSEAEIAEHNGTPIGDPETEPGLINNWLMNEAENGEIADLVGVDNLVLVNGASIQNSVISDIPLVSENDPGAVVGFLTANDSVTGDPVSTFEISNDPSGYFEIVGNQLKLKDGVALDYEEAQSFEVSIEAVGDSGEATLMTVTVQVGDIAEPNEIPGTEGTDRLISTSADEIISGGAGEDTVVYSGNRADYTITQETETTYRVTDNRPDSPDGADIVYSTENFEFADQTISAENILNAPPTDIALGLSTSTVSKNASVSDAEINVADGGGADTAQVDLSGVVDGSAEITVSFGVIDNSFELVVNGESLTGETIQLQSNVYDASNQALLQFGDGGAIDSPWVANSDGSPRLIAHITSEGVEILATRTPSSGEYEAMTIINGDFTTPSFVDGVNTVTVINPDDDGPDGLNATVSARYDEVVEGPVSGEEGALVGSLSSSDADAVAAPAYTIVDDASGLFEISGDQLKVKDGMSLDYDAQQSHDITVEVMDEHGAIYQETLTIDVQEASAASEHVYGDAGDNVLNGGAGGDIIYGGAGNDSITGGAGDDVMNGGDGSDVFVYEMGDGSDVISGGAGWTDIIDLNDGATMSLGEYGSDWTVQLTEGAITSETDGNLVFTDDAHGVISLSDGSEINFADIEQLTY